MNDWIAEIRQGLRLSPRGVLILVDDAVPERLGGLVRALLADHPDLEVLARPSGLIDLPDGAVVVLVPEAEDAAWLNINRPVFARKSLKVVLFCRREVTEVLAREAPDFYDWIAQRHECPPGVAEPFGQPPRRLDAFRALATTLNRSGRATDAEVLLRKLLTLPVEADLESRFLGLKAREAVLAFVRDTEAIELDPQTRKALWTELALALRSQGRHLEAAEVEAQRDQELGKSPPTS
ncbi:hypothetical protein [Polyangium spumosum]|uniref:Tetratricopeptide repeat protein n=1 Tax=Polyangium spumosum TaxID=889282 RepID=A0A6N7PS91_9BACT|nr:hypothetical protein [Polyangium spumosum]MRG94918.1 hypothetical protein [Polyangium spumosum]